LGQKIGCFFDQGSRKLGVVCSSRELNKRRRLTREILPAYHDIFPVRLRSAKFRKSGFSFRPSRLKMELGKKFDRQKAILGRTKTGHCEIQIRPASTRSRVLAELGHSLGWL
jgi:hypothetical protein